MLFLLRILANAWARASRATPLQLSRSCISVRLGSGSCEDQMLLVWKNTFPAVGLAAFNSVSAQLAFGRVPSLTSKDQPCGIPVSGCTALGNLYEIDFLLQACSWSFFLTALRPSGHVRDELLLFQVFFSPARVMSICNYLKRCGVGVQTAGSGHCRFKLG